MLKEVKKLFIKLKNYKQICPTCDTGRQSYLSDKHSECCPYIGELNANTGPWKKFKCPHYRKISN